MSDRPDAGSARSAAGAAGRANAQTEQHPAFRHLVTVGLVAYGVVHLLIAWIALQIARDLGGGEQQEASQQGALAELSGNPVGAVLLWVIGVGFAVLTVWQVLEAGWGHRDKGDRRTGKRLSSAGRAVLYVALCVTSVTTVLRGPRSGDQQQEDWTARLLGVTAGRVLVVAVGVAVLAVGVRQVVKGVRRSFTEDLRGGVDRRVITLGAVGYVAKGIVIAVVGVLFGSAAITADPERAGGLDDALRTLQEAPAGTWLLTAMALGLAAFGVLLFLVGAVPGPDGVGIVGGAVALSAGSCRNTGAARPIAPAVLRPPGACRERSRSTVRRGAGRARGRRAVPGQAAQEGVREGTAATADRVGHHAALGQGHRVPAHRALRGTGRGRQGLGPQADHRVPQPAHRPDRRAARADGTPAQPVVLPALHRAPAGGR
ncbi:DUF1206 domain-containing protein [Nakamurella sp. YIM 132084]|uniref:DUF1206 domain-containing protein n=1 Tax=Nakamurella leprariae TaxID=2803911 RepID=A0A938YEY4_9ACTN|nr:DUF1206 domain-containing protein [Nakamurella leprariae]